MDNNQKMKEFLKQCILNGNGYIDFEKLKQIIERTREWLDETLGKIENPENYMQSVFDNIYEDRYVDVPEKYKREFTERFLEAMEQLQIDYTSIINCRMEEEADSRGGKNGEYRTQ